ncbi:MAG: metal transporter [Gemmatimonadetes bacterium]|uniref:Metal transporter n=1 Tax=Candidatus Kutchimonas denitrificans TaxID=3056748 RepID=A0AAE4Z9B7_9BACT|nr:metal transporter [Gemmatimonadota bacterium]NIR74872.1 metal transporter [Candidatus Kutchimonas denitrificans]NIR99983.1 metal transporter [Gemmatimonadota bacterium]NIT65567.1 metal transporter [Gemmatimonadota bacterium]NIU52537.1 metal transporter [Gemmatimonadota bacterium]
MSERWKKWVTGLTPLVLLAAMTVLFLRFGPLGVFRASFPPIEELTIERIRLPEPDLMEISVVNGGPEPVTVAQMLIDEAYWPFEIEPGHTIPRLRRATIRTRYPWVEGEPHEVTLLTSTGLTFSAEIEVATQSPAPNARYLATFTLLGVYVGVLPVLIGLLWFPFLKRIDRKWINFFLSLTVGLLIFLGIDALHEAFELQERVADAFQGVGLITLGVLGAMFGIVAIGRWLRRRPVAAGLSQRLWVAYMVALGIGLHNLGEGLAIGSAYSVGAISLGAFLVVGFAIHNTTEGLGIVAPVAKERPSLWHLVTMGAIAGVPTIAGAWIGGFNYRPDLAVFFLALGAGAVLQVVWELGRVIHRESKAGWMMPLNAMGLVAGLVIMYTTALLVVA